jgi:pimeloyl-ACP methyl ester carboxylesterase
MMGDIHVAYRQWGDGPRDIVNVPNWAINVDALDDIPEMTGFLDAIARVGRYTLFEQPGTGVSDPVPLDTLPGLEQWTDTTKAVMDDAGIASAALLAADAAALPACLFAATFPERTTALILFGGFARAKADVDYPAGWHPDHAAFLLEAQITAWGSAAVQVVAAGRASTGRSTG